MLYMDKTGGIIKKKTRVKGRYVDFNKRLRNKTLKLKVVRIQIYTVYIYWTLFCSNLHYVQFCEKDFP